MLENCPVEKTLLALHLDLGEMRSDAEKPGAT